MTPRIRSSRSRFGVALAGALAVTSVVVPAIAGAQYPTRPPAPAPVKPAVFPPFQEIVLANGARMLVVRSTKQPVLSVTMAFPAGSAYDPAGKEGLASLAATLLTKGAGKRSADEISEAIESVGGSLGAGAGGDFLTVSAASLASDAPLAFELLADAIARPTFPATELDLARKQTLSGLQLELGQPASLAERFFARTLYGAHPYSRRASPKSVQAITREDLVAFHRNRIRPGGALLVVAGDITLERARELATASFAGWTGTAPAPMTFAAPPAPAATRILLVHRPGSVQSNILVGNLTTRPGAPTYYGAQVANKILGGGSDARLFMTLREQKGWTYGAYSRLARPRDIGSFQASAEVRTEVTDSSLAELLSQVRRIRTQPVSAAELEAAKGALVGSFPLGIQTAEQVAIQVSNARLLGLPANYLATYRPRLAAVTAPQAMAAAAITMRPQAMTIVVVGDAQKIHAGLARIAPVSIVGVDGTPLKATDLAPKAMAVGADAAKLVARRDSFTIMFQGNPFGTMVTALEKTPTGFRYTETSMLGPIGAQSTELTFDASLAPVQVIQTGKLQGQETNVRVVYGGGKATGSATTPSQAGPKTTAVNATLLAGTLDDNMAQVILPALAWSPGAKHTVNFFTPSKNATRPATFTVSGTESVTVPAGTFQAYKVDVSGMDQPLTMYITTATPHRLVKIAPVGAPIEMVLVK